MRGTCPEVKIIIMRITEKGDVKPGAKKKMSNFFAVIAPDDVLVRTYL